MGLLPSECPWLCGEGDIGGAEGAFAQPCANSFLASQLEAGGFEVPLASLDLTPAAPSLGPRQDTAEA